MSKRRTREQLAEQLADAALSVLLHDSDRHVDYEAQHSFEQIVRRFLEII